MYLKPKPGVDVPFPASPKLLPPGGATVPDSDYWQRRLLDGDVTEAAPPTAPVKAVAKK